MHTLIDRLARIFAQIGGGVLAMLIVLTCLSVLGRSLNGILHSDWVEAVAPNLANWLLGLGIGPINGDFELVEAGMAFAIFAFLPICQLHGAHAKVDIFTSALPARFNRWLIAVIDLVFALVLLLIAAQLFQGMESKRSSGQTTFLLEFPIWWAYGLSLLGAIVAAGVAVYVALMRIAEIALGRAILPASLEGEA